MKPLNRKLLRDMKTLKIQIFSMSLLVACGTAILIASWSAYTSLSFAKNTYYKDYGFANIFADIVRAPDFLLERIKNVKDVVATEGRIVVDGLIDLEAQDEPALGHIISISPGMNINLLHIREGRFPEPGTHLETLVHESFAVANNLRIGDTLHLNIKSQRRTAYIVGIAISPEYIYALSPLAPFPDDRHFGILWMLKDDLAQLTGLQGAFNNLVIKIQHESMDFQVIHDINLLLEPYGSVGSYGRSQQISHIFIQDEIRQQRSMSFIVPGIFILVATFILHTVLHRLISLHRSQIATLKSLGYSSLSIAYRYWKLVTVILFLGLLPGLLFAHGIGQWYTVLYRQFFRFPNIDFVISKDAFLIGVAASFIPGWTVTLFALRSVIRLQPAEAMRPLGSISFKISKLQLLLPLSKTTTLTRIIVRNISSHPGRTLLAMASLAAAVAILINGSFWSDVVDFVVNRHFRQSSREDLQVNFSHLRSPEIIRDLLQIPGVEMVEPVRIIGIKLIHRNVKKTTALIASSDDSVLRPLLNLKGKRIKPPEREVILSKYFESHYNLHRGDKVQLEISDKSHPPLSVTVGGFAEDLIGATVYARQADLQYWLDESISYNGAYLKVQPEKLKDIYTRLKKSPEVIAVQVKKILLQGFNKILSKMINTFTMILIAFAATITGAIFFNISRISLSEKSWELASMKIMGLLHKEIFQVIFIEMGVLTLLSLIPGFALGYFLSFLSTHLIHSETLNFPLVIKPETYALATVILILLYSLSGLIVYRSIKNLNMTNALKARE